MTSDSPTNQIEAFFSNFQPFSCKAGEVLLRSGKKTNWVYYLKSGIVSQSSVSPQGQEIVITFYKPKAYFPLIWVIKNAPVPYEFRAMTAVQGWKAPKDKVLSLLKNNPEITYDLATRLLSGLEGLGRKVEYALQATAHLRVSEALLTLAYRFGSGTGKQRVIEMALTHQQLADITGLTRETITRELKILREKGLVTVADQTFVIPDVGLLEGVVSSGR